MRGIAGAKLRLPGEEHMCPPGGAHKGLDKEDEPSASTKTSTSTTSTVSNKSHVELSAHFVPDP